MVNEKLLVLRSAGDALDLEDLADVHGWRDAAFFPRKEDQFYELVYETADSSSTIHYVEDHIVDVEYLLLKGDNLLALERQIRQVIDCFEDEELWRMARSRSSPEQRAFGLRALAAITRSSYDQAVLEEFEHAFTDGAAEVREACLWGISRLAWPAFLPLVGTVARSDPDESIRQLAQDLVDVYRDIKGLNP